MRTLLCFMMCVLAGGFVPASAQVQLPTANPQTQFSNGQDVVPVYEGWLRNPDGTFTFVFGYFNRNWKEELAIPAGPDNRIEPGVPDRGQPTYFLPRRQSWVFRVQVPKDWGQQELIWTIAAHGRTEKAYAQLLPEEEIIERLIMTRGNLSPGEDDPNKPPSVSIGPGSFREPAESGHVDRARHGRRPSQAAPSPRTTSGRNSTSSNQLSRGASQGWVVRHLVRVSRASQSDLRHAGPDPGG